MDSLYQEIKNGSYLKSGEQYKDDHFIKEAERIIKHFRNHGVYHFSERGLGFTSWTQPTQALTEPM